MTYPKRIFALLTACAVVIMSVALLYAEDNAKININTAAAEELIQLKRIGPKYAARIIEYREKNGPFKKPEDIIKVKGIGPKTFEMNKDKIEVK